MRQRRLDESTIRPFETVHGLDAFVKFCQNFPGLATAADDDVAGTQPDDPSWPFRRVDQRSARNAEASRPRSAIVLKRAAHPAVVVDRVQHRLEFLHRGLGDFLSYREDFRPEGRQPGFRSRVQRVLDLVLADGGHLDAFAP